MDYFALGLFNLSFCPCVLVYDFFTPITRKEQEDGFRLEGEPLLNVNV